MKIQDMSYSDFMDLPRKKWDEEITFDSLVILPARFDYWGAIKYKIKFLIAKWFKLEKPCASEVGHLHESKYRRMAFATVRGNEPICLVSGYSDVVHIEGIGGFGYQWLEKYGKVPDAIKPAGWTMDCLPGSGLIRLFPSNTRRMVCGPSLSSFSVYSVPKERE